RRPDRTLARTLPRRPRRPRDDRGAGPGVARTDPGRGRARRAQLALEPEAARSAPVAEFVHRRPAAKTAAALNAPEAAWSEAWGAAVGANSTVVRHYRRTARSNAVAWPRPYRR